MNLISAALSIAQEIRILIDYVFGFEGLEVTYPNEMLHIIGRDVFTIIIRGFQTGVLHASQWSTLFMP